MATDTNRLIHVTDDRGRLMLDANNSYEPLVCSVVLINGPHGTAFQRHASDGKWYRLGDRKPKTWDWVLCQRNVVLVYDAPQR